MPRYWRIARSVSSSLIASRSYSAQAMPTSVRAKRSSANSRAARIDSVRASASATSSSAASNAAWTSSNSASKASTAAWARSCSSRASSRWSLRLSRSTSSCAAAWPAPATRPAISSKDAVRRPEAGRRRAVAPWVMGLMRGVKTLWLMLTTCAMRLQIGAAACNIGDSDTVDGARTTMVAHPTLDVRSPPAGTIVSVSPADSALRHHTTVSGAAAGARTPGAASHE